MKLVDMGTGADGRGGGEGVFFKLVVLELGAQEGFGFEMAGAGGPARTDGATELAGRSRGL